MTANDLLAELRRCPLIASVQATEGSPLDDPHALLRLARASVTEGVGVLRLQGVGNIALISGELAKPVIGLIKRSDADNGAYITPSLDDVRELAALGCAVIATDATGRPGGDGSSLADRIKLSHDLGVLAMADCDALASAEEAAAAGADLLGTTLAGYTPKSVAIQGPDFELLRSMCRSIAKPVIAEGRYTQKWEVETALRIGAAAVVVGGALNDPVKQTRALLPSGVPSHNVGAVDIGGTWIRFATFSPDWRLQDVEKSPTPRKHGELLSWIRDRVRDAGVASVGISTAGVVDPATGEVWTAKEHLMPGYAGIRFCRDAVGAAVRVHGDGHATAWAHACRSEFSGLRVATLAIGTGVGCGFVSEGRIWAGRRGEYPRVNDVPTEDGRTYEGLLGGINLTRNPNAAQKAGAVEALGGAVRILRGFYFPDAIVVAGSVGLCDWMAPHLSANGATSSPFRENAGLYGAAALALYPCTPEI